MHVNALSDTPRNDAADALEKFEKSTRHLDIPLKLRIKTGRCTEEDLKSVLVKGAIEAWKKYRSMAGDG